MIRTPHVLYIFTSKCAFRHSGVHFFDIWTSKSGPNTSCLVHFHFRMCVSPQRRAIFRHQNFQKCSRNAVFCTFSLPNVRFATAACNFWFILSAPTSAPAALTGLLFDWPDTRIIEKTQHFVTSLTFSADVSSFTWLWHYCIFCRLTWLLYYCFSTLHIVGSFYLNFLRLFEVLYCIGFREEKCMEEMSSSSPNSTATLPVRYGIKNTLRCHGSCRSELLTSMQGGLALLHIKS